MSPLSFILPSSGEKYTDQALFTSKNNLKCICASNVLIIGFKSLLFSIKISSMLRI